MKKLLVLIIIATFLFGSAQAFAGSKKGPGDGGFFTKFFQGALGDSWKKTPAQVKQEKEARKRAKAKN